MLVTKTILQPPQQSDNRNSIPLFGEPGDRPSLPPRSPLPLVDSALARPLPLAPGAGWRRLRLLKGPTARGLGPGLSWCRALRMREGMQAGLVRALRPHAAIFPTGEITEVIDVSAWLPAPTPKRTVNCTGLPTAVERLALIL